MFKINFKKGKRIACNPSDGSLIPGGHGWHLDNGDPDENLLFLTHTAYFKCRFWFWSEKTSKTYLFVSDQQFWASATSFHCFFAATCHLTFLLTGDLSPILHSFSDGWEILNQHFKKTCRKHNPLHFLCLWRRESVSVHMGSRFSGSPPLWFW